VSYPRTDYLAWASFHHGRAEYNLATSGIPEVRIEEIAEGVNVAPPATDDPEGTARVRGWGGKRHGVPASRVCLALGASHGIWLACAAMVDPGSEVLVESPFYEPLALVPRALGATVSFFERSREDGYRLDPARVIGALTPQTRMVIVSNLHNPSGARTSVDALTKLAAELLPRGVTLMVDEVYAPFDTFLNASGTLMSTAIAPNVIVTSSLTKAFGAGPSRVGWVIAEEPILERVRFALTASIGMLPIEQANTGAFFLEHLAWLAERSKRIVGTKRERARAWTKQHGLGWSEPESGLFGLVTGLPSAGRAQEECIARGLAEHGVLVVPGHFFGVEDGIRLAWACPEDRFDEGLLRLAKVFGLSTTA